MEKIGEFNETIISGDSSRVLTKSKLLEMIALPPGESLEEWIASNMFEFVNSVSILFSTIDSFCTEETCPLMMIGSNLIPELSKNSLSAPNFIKDTLKTSELLFGNRRYFPIDEDDSVPKEFWESTRRIALGLYWIFSHLYYRHYKVYKELGISDFLNASFKHFILFVNEFSLIEIKMMGNMKKMVTKILEGV